MKMTCPHCGVVGSAPDSIHGGKVRCPHCAKVFILKEQKIACPHCGVVGSAGDYVPDTKLKCPLCAKVFLLTAPLLAGDKVGIAKEKIWPTAAPVVEDLAARKWAAPVTEPELIPVVEEPELEPVMEAVPEVELEEEALAAPVSTLQFMAEAVDEIVLEPVEADIELKLEEVMQAEPVTELPPETEVSPEAEPVIETAEISAVEQMAEAPAAEAARTSEDLVVPAAISTEVCAGCGDSFQPEFLQEVDAKLYCGVCQLRCAALDATQPTTKSGGRKRRGLLITIITLGLLALLAALLLFQNW
jgi:hypothetical protein